MTKKTYKAPNAKAVHDRPVKAQPKRSSKKVGSGSHAHPQPRTSQG